MRRGPGPSAGSSIDGADARWRLLVENAPEAILIHQDDCILFANRAAAELFAAGSADRLIGLPVWELVHSSCLDLARQRTAGVLATGETAERTELRYRRLDGGSFVGEGQPARIEENGRPAVLVVIRDVTARRRAERALEETERRFRDFAELASDWFWETDERMRYTWLSDNVELLTGAPPHWFYGKTRLEIAGPDMQRVQLAEHRRLLETRQPFRDFDFQCRMPNGDRWVRSNGRPMFDAEGRFLGYRGTGRDITAIKEAELARLETEQRYRQLVEMSPDAIVVHQDGHIIFANRQMAELVGAGGPEDLIGSRVLDFVEEADHPRVRQQSTALAAGSGASLPVEIRVRHLGGQLLHVETRAALIVDRGRPATLVVARDSSQRKLAEERLRYLAMRDSLTGLANRTLFYDRLEQAVAFAKRHGSLVALLLVDLDGFKGVNDMLGHAAGDRLLMVVGDRLRAATRECDTVSRLGGDEFAVVLTGLQSAHGAYITAGRILDSLAEPVTIDGHPCRIAGSIGAALAPEHAEDPDALLRAADTALYSAKDTRRGGMCLFDPSMRARAERRREIEAALRSHLANRALEVWYQPVVELESGVVMGLEALVRWPCENGGGRIPPDLFVGVAEECGLIEPLGELVLRRACRETRELMTRLGRELRIAVNISPQELAGADSAGRIAAILAETGLPPGNLELEITERELLRHSRDVARTLDKLEAMGVALAIDDFGTGYSSLVYLKRFPVRRLKLDRTFVAGLPEDTEDKAIVRAVMSLAHMLRIPVLAEGVETELQRRFLSDAGCREAQGYLWHPPLPLGELLEVLEGRRPENCVPFVLKA